MDPSLGRFTSPDTIVPTGTQGTQAWDRYAFVNNNPVRYNDPTGHQITGEKCGLDDCESWGSAGSTDDGGGSGDGGGGKPPKKPALPGEEDNTDSDTQCTFTDGNNATCTTPDSEVDGLIKDTKIAEIAEGSLVAMGTVGVCFLSAGLGCSIAGGVGLVFMIYENQAWSDLRDVLSVKGDVTMQISYDPDTGNVTLDNGVDRAVTLPPSMAATWVLDKFGLLSTIHY